MNNKTLLRPLASRPTDTSAEPLPAHTIAHARRKESKLGHTALVLERRSSPAPLRIRLDALGFASREEFQKENLKQYIRFIPVTRLASLSSNQAVKRN